jgi:hypothetical protein
VTGVTLPRDAATPPDEEDLTQGLRLAQRMRNAGCRSPVVFTSERSDAALYAQISALDPSAFVRLGADWGSGLAFELRKFLRKDPSEKPKQRPNSFSLDIVFRKDYSWRLTGKGVEDGGQIYVNPELLEDVKNMSELIQQRIGHATWAADLSRIRSGLDSLLFLSHNNRRLYKRVIEAKTLFGGAENTRIRFIVNDDTPPIVLEALQDPDRDEGAYWMLKAPIYRRYDRLGLGYPLFKDRATRHGQINCLIIEADPASGKVGGSLLEELTCVKHEVETIHEILKKEQNAHGSIGRLEVFRADEHENPVDAVDKLVEILEGDTWHLVHFAGHALYAESKGAVVLKGREGGTIGAKRFADLLEKKTRFLYLSSCKSADAYFVMNLVERRIPAVLGFRWPVSDPGAEEYARQFYANLFNDSISRKFLEYAFLRAKKRLYDRSESDPTWAAPVLVMQVDEPEEDSTEFADPRAGVRAEGLESRV